jgi:hypothetical protein
MAPPGVTPLNGKQNVDPQFALFQLTRQKDDCL